MGWPYLDSSGIGPLTYYYARLTCQEMRTQNPDQPVACSPQDSVPSPCQDNRYQAFSLPKGTCPSPTQHLNGDDLRLARPPHRAPNTYLTIASSSSLGT